MGATSTPVGIAVGSLFMWLFCGSDPDPSSSYGIAKQEPAELLPYYQARISELEAALANVTTAVLLDNVSNDSVFDLGASQDQRKASSYQIASDPLNGFVQAFQQSAALMHDVANHILDVASSQIWAWPSDSSIALDSSTALATLALDGHELSEWTTGLFVQARERLPMSFIQQIIDVPLAAIKPALSSGIEGFLERYPAHRATLHGRDPFLVIVSLVGIVILTLWELYGMWWCLRHIVCRVAVCCCKRQPSAAMNANSEQLASHTSDSGDSAKTSQRPLVMRTKSMDLRLEKQVGKLYRTPARSGSFDKEPKPERYSTADTGTPTPLRNRARSSRSQGDERGSASGRCVDGDFAHLET